VTGPQPGPGRSPAETVVAFDSAFNAQALDDLAGLLTDDCVFEGTVPPDGDRHEGRDAVLAAFAAVFAGSVQATFTTEERLVSGDRVVARWRYDWVDREGRPGHVRGVDVFRVSGDRVAEKLSYVKG
jgi:ketosteroid isomerase-like protein